MSTSEMGKKQKKASKLRYEEPKNIEAARRHVIKSIEGDRGNDVFKRVEKSFIKSSSMAFNHMTGGGWCLGRIYEVFGPPSGGKTAWLYDAIANAQRQYPKRYVSISDAEKTWDETRAEQIGVNLDKIDIHDPQNAQAAFDDYYKMCMSGAYSILGIDSFAALMPVEDLLADVAAAKDRMAVFASVASIGLRKLVGVAARSKTCLIVVNQQRASMAMYGEKNTTPGGNALKHYASCRIQVTPKSGDDNKFMDGEEQIGHRIKLYAKKNKMAPPFRTSEIDLFYAKPFDVVNELRSLAIQNHIIVNKKNEKGYLYDGKQLAKNREELNLLLRKDEKLRFKLMGEVEKAMNTGSDMYSDESKEFEDAGDGIEDSI
jgi:recombination protein RecA